MLSQEVCRKVFFVNGGVEQYVSGQHEIIAPALQLDSLGRAPAQIYREHLVVFLRRTVHKWQCHGRFLSQSLNQTQVTSSRKQPVFPINPRATLTKHPPDTSPT